jgi:hypothetical protein
MRSIIMSSSATDAATSLSLNLEYLKLWQSNSSSSQLSAITMFSNIKLNDIHILRLLDSHELWSQEILVILEILGLYEINISGFD